MKQRLLASPLLPLSLILMLMTTARPRTTFAYAGHCAKSDTIQTELGFICTNPEGLIKDILTIALGIAGGVALLLMILGTGMYVLSTGNPEKVEEAKHILTAAVSGVLLIFFSVFLLKFIGVDLLGIPGLTGSSGGVVTP